MAKKKEPDRLSRESSAALAAGMSYGKWKALQPPDVIVPPPKPKMIAEKTCKFCGKTFYQADNRKRKYCSDQCRYEADLVIKKRTSKRWREEHPDYQKEYRNAMSTV